MKPTVLGTGLVVLAWMALSVAADAGGRALMTASRNRRPVAAELIDGGRCLCVANRRSGSVSLIDTQSHRVVHEQQLGQRLTGIAALDDETLLLTDEQTHELLVARHEASQLTVIERHDVARHPVQVVSDSDARVIAVAGLWSQRVTLFSVTKPGDQPEGSKAGFLIEVGKTVRLPFSPRLMSFVDEGRRLIATDAFGGQLAVIDTGSASIESIRELPAQNLRGLVLAATGDRLLLTHQTLSSLARSDFDDIHWGNLLQNVMRDVPMSAVLDPQADLLDGDRVVPLGDVGEGAADPAGIALLPEQDGWIVCLSGTGEVAIRTRQGGGRVKVATQPTSVVWNPQRELAYVLCTLDDTIAVVDPLRQQVAERISLGPQPEETPADRGERLYVDGLRSHDGWISCQSCHPDGHTTGGLADTQSDDSYGTPKRILSLLGTRDANPWAWNGQFRELHGQVASSFSSTLQGESLSASDASDVVAYLHTLTPPPAVDEGEWSDEDLARINAGRQVFDARRCAMCHVPSQTYTIDQTFDVGLTDEEGLRKFNPPSLRGLSHRRRFFHDGRAESLEEVFTEYGHQLDDPLDEEEVESLLMFLNSL